MYILLKKKLIKWFFIFAKALCKLWGRIVFVYNLFSGSQSKKFKKIIHHKYW